jgi:hypothetical protein
MLNSLSRVRERSITSTNQRASSSMFSAAFIREPGTYDAEFNELNALIDAAACKTPEYPVGTCLYFLAQGRYARPARAARGARHLEGCGR